MIPSLVALQLRTAITEYLSTTYAIGDEDTRSALDKDFLCLGVNAEFIPLLRSATNRAHLDTLAELLPEFQGEAAICLAEGVQSRRDVSLSLRLARIREAGHSSEVPDEPETADFEGDVFAAAQNAASKAVSRRWPKATQQNPDAKTLLTTFTTTLANDLQHLLRSLSPTGCENVEVVNVDKVVSRILRESTSRVVATISDKDLDELFVAATRARDSLHVSYHGKPSRFLQRYVVT